MDTQNEVAAVGQRIVKLAEDLADLGFVPTTSKVIGELQPVLLSLAEKETGQLCDVLLVTERLIHSAQDVWCKSWRSRLITSFNARLEPAFPELIAQNKKDRAAFCERLRRLGQRLVGDSAKKPTKRPPRKGSLESKIVPLLKQGMSVDAICERLGCGAGNVTMARSRHLPKRPKKPNTK